MAGKKLTTENRRTPMASKSAGLSEGASASLREASAPPASQDEITALRGASARIVENMEASLTIPTATSYRAIPVKLLEENRQTINEHPASGSREKVSYTHIIAWAIVQALKEFPALNSFFQFADGAAHRVTRHSINLGVAIDVERKDGTRSLLVPNIKGAGELTFQQFLAAYADLVGRVRKGAIQPADFQDTTVTLTNPGTVGTVASQPRLMTGQGAIIATGAIGYPAEYHAWSPQALSGLGLSKVMNISCTYDHRVIQGAESGRFLGRIQELLLGHDGFYERVFEDLRLPDKPLSLDQSPARFGGPLAKDELEKQAGVLQLINLYRVRGHLIANLDPLGEHAFYHPELDPATYGLTVWDLDREFVTGGLGGLPRGTLRQILAVLRQTYCQKIGVEYRHIQHPEEKSWIQERMEPAENRAPLDAETKRQILRSLAAAEGFERFLHTRFIGHKRFGLEGAETTIPVLEWILSEAALNNVQEAVIGMAHRGRLNVLANIIGKPFEKIFSEFEENVEPLVTQGSGDVKYHLSSAGTFRTAQETEVRVSVAPNPSHLEWVNPVVEGIVRAKQERRGDRLREQVIPILIHGDAAFAGQGVVPETLNLSQLRGYRTGGTIHIIINNQIGFTTPPEEARSSPYPTDVAKSVQAPIFHVNGDDPEAATRVAKIAFAYRQRFRKDVVIDIFCYRRHGHNEGDEPSYTQPLLYKKINEHPSVLTLYSERLVQEGSLRQEELDSIREAYHRRLEAAYEETRRKEQPFEPDIPLAVSEDELREFQPTEGAHVGMDLIKEVAGRLTALPDGFRLHPKLQPFVAKRRELLDGDTQIDWAYAEALAFGSLVCEGTPVRLSGQDCARGTFSQRHLVLCDLETGEEYVPLKHVHPHQAQFDVFDSSLSEAAVLGFEFGYSGADPLTLVIWEAQFGDFANGAQVIIDNFIASSESKWRQPCDLVLLLPHGYEGQGPEHSSARLERFLSLCAEDNIQVCYPSTPAQYFHVLRRQMRDARRKPLIVMTPKSLLRHPRATSHPQELADGSFSLVLDDPYVQDKDSVRRVLLCSGKIYYDLLLERERRNSAHIAIARVEQFHPFPEWNIANTLASYTRAKEIFWVQEEPQNMGAWPFLRHLIPQTLPVGRALRYVGRPESASPAAGSLKVHRQEQSAVVNAAFE
ncbi:MAG: multifunctional oxoglutarate decarboxylase/oxoglutarate dehydrogenase thiamine pyrophosphate-binding subunit/dihydrolipoyllysine-residue succinyltransferase subunit [Acidobacteria bacterium]|nr:MAG: multifunctional oxoglutarate decarboxylase/oxoglutarate dehydrogenase thiamine pyrophosphate-binding subunit/dihydrolipoyllysine-residue succinyltransferase subunit [Acidobacteriota bacterium]